MYFVNEETFVIQSTLFHHLTKKKRAHSNKQNRFHFRSEMSFLNLTLMGYDNRFKSMKHLDTEPLRNVPIGGQPKSSLEKQLAREMTGDFQSREWTSPAISNL